MGWEGEEWGGVGGGGVGWEGEERGDEGPVVSLKFVTR